MHRMTDADVEAELVETKDRALILLQELQTQKGEDTTITTARLLVHTVTRLVFLIVNVMYSLRDDIRNRR